MTQNHPCISFFFFPFIKISVFHIYFVCLFCDFVVLVQREFVHRLCVVLFVFLVSFKYWFSSDSHISFDSVQIQSMTLTSSTLQIRRHGYSGYFNIVICVGFCTLSFDVINMDDVSLFANSSFFVFSEFALYQCILSI